MTKKSDLFPNDVTLISGLMASSKSNGIPSTAESGFALGMGAGLVTGLLDSSAKRDAGSSVERSIADAFSEARRRGIPLSDFQCEMDRCMRNSDIKFTVFGYLLWAFYIFGNIFGIYRIFCAYE